MSFIEAAQAPLRKYATFSGRATRQEFWSFWLAIVIVYGVTFVVVPIVGGLIALALIIPSLAVSVRRLHDINRSGWWYLLGFVPFGGLVVLYFFVKSSTPGENKYGPFQGATVAPTPASA